MSCSIVHTDVLQRKGKVGGLVGGCTHIVPPSSPIHTLWLFHGLVLCTVHWENIWTGSGASRDLLNGPRRGRGNKITDFPSEENKSERNV